MRVATCFQLGNIELMLHIAFVLWSDCVLQQLVKVMNAENICALLVYVPSTRYTQIYVFIVMEEKITSHLKSWQTNHCMYMVLLITFFLFVFQSDFCNVEILTGIRQLDFSQQTDDHCVKRPLERNVDW